MSLSNKKHLSSFNSHLSLRKGFTLIELLIVIAILGILAAAVLVAINPGQRIAASRNARVRSDLANMGNLANVFNTDTGLSTACVGGGSYPSLFGQTACGASYIAQPAAPSGTYTYAAIPASCAPNTASPCTAVAISGPAYSDGVINATTNNTWCWRSAAGTITQTTAAGCTP